MRVTILGKRWDLRFVPLRKNWGDCDKAPDTPGKEIRVDPKHPDERELLDTILHEVLHCALPHHEEEVIARLANDLTRILWRLGWRKVIEGPKPVNGVNP